MACLSLKRNTSGLKTLCFSRWTSTSRNGPNPTLRQQVGHELGLLTGAWKWVRSTLTPKKLNVGCSLKPAKKFWLPSRRTAEEEEVEGEGGAHPLAQSQAFCWEGTWHGSTRSPMQRQQCTAVLVCARWGGTPSAKCKFHEESTFSTPAKGRDKN